MRANQFSISFFYCQECNNKFPLPRPKNKLRKNGHIKDLYCPFCNKTTKMIEHKNMIYDMKGRLI